MSRATRLQSPLAIAQLDGRTWVVAYEGVLIPGAILGSAQAASDYASDLARAAGFTAILPRELRPLDAARSRSRFSASHRRLASHGCRTMTPAVRRGGQGARRSAAP